MTTTQMELSGRSSGAVPTGRVEFEPDSIQTEILTDEHRYRVVAAGRRSGKTWLNVGVAGYEAFRGPQRRVWYVSPDWNQAREFWGPLMASLPPRSIAKVNESTKKILLHNGSSIECRNATHQDRLRGSGLDFAIVDEFQDVHPDLFEVVLWPALADRNGSALFSGTPKGLGSRFHEYYQRALQPELWPEWRSWRFTARETGTVRRDVFDRARADAERSGATSLKLWQREWMADWTVFKGQIFDGWDADRMTYRGDLPSVARVVGGMDWGFSVSHPGALVIAGADKSERWWIPAETLSDTGTISGYWVPAARAAFQRWLPGQTKTLWLPDDRPDGVREMRLADTGWDVREARRDPGSVWSGINSLALLIEQDRLRVHESCRALLQQIPSYRWEETKGGQALEKPHKAFDDAVDALRYALHSETSMPRAWVR